MTDIVELAKACRRASYDLAVLETSKKNEALNNIAKVLQEHKDEIFSANKLDVQQACDNKLNQAFVETIAGQWVRSGVETADEAMRLAEAEQKKIMKNGSTKWRIFI